MFRHCVMFRWADDVSDETQATVSAGLDALATLPCVSAYHHGPDAGVSDGNWDYVAVGDCPLKMVIFKGHIAIAILDFSLLLPI